MKDHREIGQKMDLFHMQEEAQGSVFWHHNGYVLYRIIEDFIREKIYLNGYIEVKTPQLVDNRLWEKSGHWDKFKENMFVINDQESDRQFAIKPMNCPCHIEIFKQGIKSYKELPIRMSEFGSCHRNENSGSLNGLFRLRSFVQDDAHIFCTPEQIIEESKNFCSLLADVYTEFGFNDIKVKLSTRPEKRIGSDEVWDEAEKSLKEAAKETNFDYEINEGEGAFYGPKLEFTLKDNLGREWQCGTLQVDFNLPGRLGAEYVDSDGKKKTPVMLHRAILGSMERFIGILLEHYEGWLPLWLAPTQVIVAGISNEQDKYCQNIYEDIKDYCRVELRIEPGTISSKIAEMHERKIRFLLLAGKKEVESGTVTVKDLQTNKQYELMLSDVFKFLSPYL